MRRHRRHLLALGAVAALATGCTFMQQATVAPDGGPADASSDDPSLSRTGRYVAFESFARNLVPEPDENLAWDIFVRDVRTSTTTRVSVDTNGDDAASDSFNPSISADGRYVAFDSGANDLVPGDNSGGDVFVRDLQSLKTKRVSVDTAARDANGDSSFPSISADGRKVAFHSTASDLVAGDTNGFDDLFVRDLDTNTTARVSVDVNGGNADAPTVFGSSISGDGRHIAFASTAGDLVSGDGNGIGDVFVRNLQTGVTKRLSVGIGGTNANGYSFGPDISDDGGTVSYGSVASNLVAGDGDSMTDVFVTDVQTVTTTRASVDRSGDDANGGVTTSTSISDDGRYVAFGSEASDLVLNDTYSFVDTFVRDLQTGITTRASVDSVGRQLGIASSVFSAPSISGDARYISYVTSVQPYPNIPSSWVVVKGLSGSAGPPPAALHL